MSLLPRAGLYRWKDPLQKYLYARGFDPRLLTIPPPPPKPVYLFKGNLFKTVSVKEQMKRLKMIAEKLNLPPQLAVVGSVPEDSALCALAHLVKRRIKKFGMEAEPYAIPCFLPLEEVMEEVEEPKLLVLYGITKESYDNVRTLIRLYNYCFRLVVLNSAEPLTVCRYHLGILPELIFRF